MFKIKTHTIFYTTAKRTIVKKTTVIAQVLNTQKILAIKKAYGCDAGTDQMSNTPSPVYSLSAFLCLATSRWLKTVKSVCVHKLVLSEEHPPTFWQ